MATINFNLELQTAICGGSGETKLWRAVLEEALRTDPPGKVREWLSSEDGRLVVSLAGVDPDWVSEQIVPIMHASAGGRRYAGRYSRRRSGKPLGRPAQSRAALTH